MYMYTFTKTYIYTYTCIKYKNDPDHTSLKEDLSIDAY
jgi:hypothetical protein